MNLGFDNYVVYARVSTSQSVASHQAGATPRETNFLSSEPHWPPEWLGLTIFPGAMSPRKTTTPPKKVVVHIESKESEDSNPLEDDSVAELPIPWRTSRRLQEATYRMIQERDGGHAIHSAAASKQKHSPGSSPQGGKSAKREHSTSDSDAEGSELTDEGKEEKKPTVESRKKRKSVHFSDPLVVYIDDRKQSTASPSKTPPRKSEEGGDVSQPTTISPPKQIMSCFDLLCNHVGPKGWRCYRTCIEGTSYCNYHQTSNASIVRISVCT